MRVDFVANASHECEQLATLIGYSETLRSEQPRSTRPRATGSKEYHEEAQGCSASSRTHIVVPHEAERFVTLPKPSRSSR